MFKTGFFARFFRSEKGNLAIETMFIISGVWLAFLVMVTIFDVYRQSSANQKASYAISDLVSRQTTPLDGAFMDGTKALFETLARAPRGSTIRVTSVKYDLAEDKYVLVWSQSNGYQPAATADEVAGWKTRLPIMPDQEHITVVETWSRFDPAFLVGFDINELYNFIFTRPRYAPRVCWEVCT